MHFKLQKYIFLTKSLRLREVTRATGWVFACQLEIESERVKERANFDLSMLNCVSVRKMMKTEEASKKESKSRHGSWALKKALSHSPDDLIKGLRKSLQELKRHTQLE